MSKLRTLVSGGTGWIRGGRARNGPARPARRRPTTALRLEALESRIVPIAPTVLDPNLGLRTVASGLTTPTSMTFLGANDFLVTEKNTGKIDHVINGVVAPTSFNFGGGPIPN